MITFRGKKYKSDDEVVDLEALQRAEIERCRERYVSVELNDDTTERYGKGYDTIVVNFYIHKGSLIVKFVGDDSKSVRDGVMEVGYPLTSVRRWYESGRRRPVSYGQ